MTSHRQNEVKTKAHSKLNSLDPSLVFHRFEKAVSPIVGLQLWYYYDVLPTVGYLILVASTSLVFHCSTPWGDDPEHNMDKFTGTGNIYKKSALSFTIKIDEEGKIVKNCKHEKLK